MVVDYPIHLVEIREWKDTSVFQTDVKQVFDLIRCSASKEELLELIQNDAAYQSMEEDAYEVATNYIKAEEMIQIKDEYKREDGKIDMCQALKELIKDGRIEGYAKGRTEGRTEGRAEGVREVVINMVMYGVEDKDIQKFTGCGLDMIVEVRRENDAKNAVLK